MGFKKSADGYVDVYTDGSFMAPYGGIGVYFGDPDLDVSCRAQDPVGTCHDAEIQAATKALTVLKSHGELKVNLHTDSQALKNEYRKAGNLCWWKSFDEAKMGMFVNIHLVSGKDSSLREADKLAYKAVV